jgi:RNA polymerase sigma factor (sigma-70 family)
VANATEQERLGMTRVESRRGEWTMSPPAAGAAWPESAALTNLVRDAQCGADALDALLSILRPLLVAFFVRRVPLSSAEDLTQLALVRVVGALPRIHPEQTAQYVMTIARNVLRSEYRRRAREARRHVSLHLAEDVEAPLRVDEEAEYRELARAIHRVTSSSLPASLRDVVIGLLRGLTPAEIAAQQHVQPITVRTRLMRARALLRHELSPFLDDALGSRRRAATRRHPSMS